MNRSSQKNLRKERLRLSRKRRKRKKFTSSLGAPFNVVAVTDRIASTWAADFSLGDSVTDGLGGTWTLSGTKQNDPNAKRTGSAPDSTQGSTRIPFASTRTPRMLGSLNVLDLYENDLISVTGSCDENGNNKGSVKRKPIAPLASSKTASKTKSKTKSKTTSKRIPIHKPNDVKARWWYGTIVRSGRGLVDGKWPLNDRRQRTGRFPQNAVLLYNASKLLIDLNNDGKLEEIEEKDNDIDQYRCQVCNQLTKEIHTKSDQLLEDLGIIPIYLNSNTTDGTQSTGTSWDGAGAIFTDVCSTCAFKLIGVCQTVARNSLLKPNTKIIKKSLTQAAFVKGYGKGGNGTNTGFGTGTGTKQDLSNVPLPPQNEQKGMQSPRHHYRKSFKYNTNNTNNTNIKTDQNGHETIAASIKHGVLGIKFNQEGEVVKILRNTQGYEINGLSKGDRLISIDGIVVEGFTTTEMMGLLSSKPRPVNVTFVRHQDWPRDETNGLPDVDMKLLSDLFLKHDKSEESSLTSIQFASFMSEIHEISSEHQGREINTGFFPVELATRLIDAHDTNGDQRLDLEELNEWISSGLSMSTLERNAFKKRGGYCLESSNFVEELAIAMQWIPEDAPVYMTQDDLWAELDNNEDDAEELERLRLLKKELYEDENTQNFDDELNVMSEENEVGTSFYVCQFETGPLGIQFNHEGMIEKIGQNTQADGMKILSRGDLLDRIGSGTEGISTIGMTFPEMELLMNTMPRPMTLKFEHHQKWQRSTSTGLPWINFKKLDQLFDRFDPGTIGSMGVEELSLMWSRVHDMAIKQRGLSEEENSFNSNHWAEKLIMAHDDDNSGRLDKSELVHWVSTDAELSAGERAIKASRGGYCPASMQFVEDVSYGLAMHIKKGPMSQRYVKRKPMGQVGDSFDLNLKTKVDQEGKEAVEVEAEAAAEAEALQQKKDQEDQAWEIEKLRLAKLAANEKEEKEKVNQFNQKNKEKERLAKELKEEEENEDLIVVVFEDGPMGMRLNHENEIDTIQRDSQACKYKGLSKGDLLVKINGIDVHGQTLVEVKSKLKDAKRPMRCIFERHIEWERNETGLPSLCIDKITTLFQEHENENKVVTVSEFAAFINAVHSIAMDKQGREKKDESYFASLVLAQQLIDAHDSNDDAYLDLTEVLEWVNTGLQRSKEEQEAYRARGGYCPASCDFLEEIAIGFHQDIPIEIKEVKEKKKERTKLLAMIKMDDGLDGERIEEEKGEEEKKEDEEDQEQSKKTTRIDLLPPTTSEETNESTTATILTPPEYLTAVFNDGPIGIKFNRELEVETIKKDSQANEIAGLSRGDWLVTIAGKDVKNQTFNSITDLLSTSIRPMELIFERTTKFGERSENTGLPKIKMDDLEIAFAAFIEEDENGDGDDNMKKGIGCEKFAQFMIEIHERSLALQGREIESDLKGNATSTSTLILAQRLIDAHDDNGDELLEWNELIKWIEGGLSMSNEEREAYRSRGGHCPQSVDFLEDISICF